MKKLSMFVLLSLMVFCALLAFGTQAHAYSITPSSLELLLSGTELTEQPSQTDINEAIANQIGPAVELYKAEVDEGEDTELPLWASYETTFSDTPTDPSGATITYIDGPIVGPPAYLLVKDGNHDPFWYLFDLNGWDGMEGLVLTGFWPEGGAISHVSLYSVAQPVPEPATILLLGAGLLGVVGYNRKRFGKKA